jgi:hypothetical protein
MDYLIPILIIVYGGVVMNFPEDEKDEEQKAN